MATRPIKLNKDEQAQFNDLVGEVGAAHAVLDEALSAYNEAVRIAFEALKEKADAYNDALGAAREFAEEVSSDLRGAFDEKSEKWQESDKGQAADSFISTWEDLPTEEFDPEEPTEAEGPEDPTDELNAMPMEPDGA